MKYKHIKSLTNNVSIVEYQKTTCILKRRKGLNNEAKILKRLNKHGVNGVPKILVHNENESDNVDEQEIVCSYQQGEDLFDYINNRWNIKLNKIKTIFKLVLNIVKNAHNKQIFHRDIKLENIIIEENKNCEQNNGSKDEFNVSLIDWEFAQKFGTENLKLAGTMEYIAPEAVTLNYIGPENDIWSLGILLYFLLEDRFPWKIDDTDIDSDHYTEFLSELIYAFDIDYDHIKRKDYIPLYKAIFVPYKERCTLDYIISYMEKILT